MAATLRIDLQDGFEWLRKTSNETNTPLRFLAATVVDAAIGHGRELPAVLAELNPPRRSH
ncbi:hypothetical protein [Isoptericola sp. NPDC057391]|uniref:hypothetical protein n=1 Tax=Isoptericola sp. NPDC057391 TaxID=3346117 RepID=UPI003626D4EF